MHLKLVLFDVPETYVYLIVQVLRVVNMFDLKRMVEYKEIL